MLFCGFVLGECLFYFWEIYGGQLVVARPEKDPRPRVPGVWFKLHFVYNLCTVLIFLENPAVLCIIKIVCLTSKNIGK